MKKISVIAMALTVFVTSSLGVSATELRDVFSAEYYADQYEDLYAAFGYDEEALYQHYLTYGMNEGRNMSPVLDVLKYREMYDDLDNAFGDNWDAYVEHYFTFGIAERRDSGTSFDPIAYMEAYDDIEVAFGNDYEAIVNHYLLFGIEEGRTDGTVVMQSEEIKQATENTAAATTTPQTTPETESSSEDGIQKEYDEEGNLIRETCQNSDGSVTVWEYDNTYWDGTEPVRCILYNSDGSIGAGSYEYYEWNADSRIISQKCYVEDGYMIIENNYEEDLSVTKFYENDKITTINIQALMSGYYYEVHYYEYDEQGGWTVSENKNNGDSFVLVKQTTYNSAGVVVGYSIYEWDEEGNLVKRTDYNSDGSIKTE